jgi:hypothetical protein
MRPKHRKICFGIEQIVKALGEANRGTRAWGNRVDCATILRRLFAIQLAMPTIASDDAGKTVSDAGEFAGAAADDGETTSDSEAASEGTESVQRTSGGPTHGAQPKKAPQLHLREE